MAGIVIFIALAAQAAADSAASGAGTITVAVAPDTPVSPSEAALLAEGVGEALSGASFLVLPGQGVGRYTARVSLTRSAQGPVTAPGSAIASSAGVANLGAGLRVTLPTNKQQIHELMVSTLTLSLVSRKDGRVIWTGKALTAQVEGTRADAPGELGRRLTQALMTRYPQPAPETLSVP